MGQRSPGVHPELSVAWLLEPLPVDTFLDEIWGRDHHHISRAGSGYFDALLPQSSTVDGLLELLRHEPSALRLVRGIDKKGPDHYQLADGSLDIDGVRSDVAAGYMYVDADRPAREIQRDTDKAVVVESLPAPTDLRVEAGDALYVPRGRVHAASSHAETSIHLTVGIHAPTVLMLAIGALYSQSFRDDRLNARLPARHLDDPNLGATVRDLVRDAIAAADDPAGLAGGIGLLSDVLVRRGTCPPVGKIAGANGIGGQTRVVKHQPLYAQAKTVDDGVTLQFASLSINAGADHAAAMRFAATSTEPLQVGDLPGLRPDQQVDLVRTLIVSGFLIRVDG